MSSVQQKIDEVSPTFCPIKWKHATLKFPSATVKSCCHQDFKSWDENSFSQGRQLHDTEQDQSERQELLEGKKAASCKYCWWIEENKQISDRILWSRQWVHPAIDSLAENITPQAKNPSWVELNFSSTCNLKCSYCSPIFSTSWAAEVEQHGPYPTHPFHNNSKNLSGMNLENREKSEEMLSQFWPWMEKVHRDVRLLKITGGEPLLSPKTLELLRWLKDHPNPQLTLSVNSNLTVPQKIWDPFIAAVEDLISTKKIRDFYLHPSLDGYGAQAEYIRSGLDFQTFKSNLESYLEKTSAGHVVIICTLNNLSLHSMMDLWKYILELKRRHGPEGKQISIATKVLMFPHWQRISLLPARYQKSLEDVLAFARKHQGPNASDIWDSEILDLEQALQMQSSPTENAEGMKANFYRFFSESDRRKGVDFLETFPDMMDFWAECSRLAHESPTMNN